MSDSAILTVVNNFAKGASNAANTGTSSLRSLGLSPVLPGVLTTVPINQSYSQRTNCTAGGHHETNGHISGTIDTQSSFSRLILNGTTTITDYRCMQNGWVVNGDPYISNSGEIRVTGSHSSFDFRQSLGWKALNTTNGNSFSCQHNVLVTWDDLTGGRVQGYVTCTPPQTTITISGTF